MFKRATAIAAVALVLAGAAAAGAESLKLTAGNIVIEVQGWIAPSKLSASRPTPITIHDAGTIGTVDGSLPPILKRVELDFDRHGLLETAGLPVCHASRLRATTVAQARRQCPGAIVGRGFGKAVVDFPEQAPIPVASPLTIFNGPKKGGDATVIVHAFTTVPVSTTYMIPIRIEQIDHPRYRYHVDVDLPPIAGGNGIPVYGRFEIGKRWTHGGVRRSYVSARCGRGFLLAHGVFSFDNDTVVSGTYVEDCTPRGAGGSSTSIRFGGGA